MMLTLGGINGHYLHSGVFFQIVPFLLESILDGKLLRLVESKNRNAKPWMALSQHLHNLENHLDFLLVHERRSHFGLKATHINEPLKNLWTNDKPRKRKLDNDEIENFAKM
jgi:hypothetical protein